MSLLIMFVYLLPLIMGIEGFGAIKAIYYMGNYLRCYFGNTCNTQFPIDKISTRRLRWSIIDTRIANITTNHWFVWISGHNEQFDLILIAVLILVFQESGFGVISI